MSAIYKTLVLVQVNKLPPITTFTDPYVCDQDFMRSWRNKLKMAPLMSGIKLDVIYVVA